MALEIMHFDFYIICVVIGCSYIKCFTIDLVAAKWFLRKTGFYASQMTGGEDRLQNDLYKLCYCVKQIPYCTKLAARYTCQFQLEVQWLARCPDTIVRSMYCDNLVLCCGVTMMIDDEVTCSFPTAVSSVTWSSRLVANHSSVVAV